MMKEYEYVSQSSGEPFRRWFYNNFFDLIIWFEPDGSTRGFELCYDKNGIEKSLRWNVTGSYTHSRIDNGEGRPFRHKSSPIAVKDGLFDANDIGEKFLAVSDTLPENIRSLILEVIQGINGKHQLCE